MYDGYHAIAGAYDRFNADVDYVAWSAFIDACFNRFLPAKPQIVLDLACGTGRMTFSLADRGYDMIGIDGSADMLAEAFEKSAERQDRLFEKICSDKGIDPDGEDIEEAIRALAEHPAPLFLEQDMRAFELYGTVDAAVCCLDSINYLTGDDDLAACLACLHLYIAPGGLLIFDVNTPYKFTNTYGNRAYVLEDEDEQGRMLLCAWQNEYDPATKLCHFYLSLFHEEADGRYARSDEEQCERCYGEEELRAALDAAGFDLCGIYAGFEFEEARPDTERWYLIARTRKRGDWYLSDQKSP